MERHTSSEQEMQALGEELSRALRSGEVIELIGDVGAGKTTLVKGLARGLGVDETVQSPSFTLSRVYETGDGKRLAHYDFYRLSDPGILADELADVAGEPDTITVVEWAAIVEGALPQNHIVVRITSPTENDRDVVISGVSL